MSRLTERLRNITDPAPSRVREHPLRTGAILLTLATLVVFSAVTHNIPLINGKPGYPAAFEFKAANQVNDRTPVRVHGVEVGRVDTIDGGGDPRQSSRVEVRITDETVSVRRDAKAAIRWRTVLGGSMYIDLDPGSPREPELGDGTIPTSRTTNQTELDDVLRIYNGDTEAAQRDALRGLAEGFGDPKSAGQAIRALPKLDTVRRGLPPVRGTESGDLRKVVAATATTVEALGSDVGSLQGLVTGARRTLGATADRRGPLGDFLELSPGTLDETRTTMRRLRGTLDHLDPLVQDLRPGVQRIKATSDATRPALREADLLLRQVRPVLQSAQPTFSDLTAVSDAGIPIIKGLEPTIDRLNDETLPFLAERDDSTRLQNFASIGPTFSVLNMAAAEYDSEGYRLHLSTLIGTNSVITLARSNMARSCRMTATPAQDGQCTRIASVLTQGLVGKAKR